MKKDGIVAHMIHLGHPMDNRYNWGGVNHERKSVVLLVWTDKVEMIDGKPWWMIRGPIDGKTSSPIGRGQRDEHIELIRQGYDCYLINQVSVDKHAVKRERASFEDRNVRSTGKRLDRDDGSVLLEVTGRIDVYDFVRGAS
jgi:hypothetical protein